MSMNRWWDGVHGFHIFDIITHTSCYEYKELCKKEKKYFDLHFRWRPIPSKIESFLAILLPSPICTRSTLVPPPPGNSQMLALTVQCSPKAYAAFICHKTDWRPSLRQHCSFKQCWERTQVMCQKCACFVVWVVTDTFFSPWGLNVDLLYAFPAGPIR